MSRLDVLTVAAIALAGVAGACATRDAAPRAAPLPEPPVPVAVSPLPPAASPSVDAFESEVRPVLARRCTPCHVPGGKMYERLPFDDPKTVRTNREGILRRLDGDDKAALERWLAGT